MTGITWQTTFFNNLRGRKHRFPNDFYTTNFALELGNQCKQVPVKYMILVPDTEGWSVNVEMNK